MQLTFTWSRIETLNALALFDIIKSRESVFVVEQRCPYQETDEMDKQCWHLVVSIENELVAYARLVDPGIKYQQPSIGRVLTTKQWRGANIGRALMEEAIRFSEHTFPAQDIKIGAQVYLQKFYESCGFKAVTDAYDEDGIPHLDMIRASQ